MIRDKDMVVTRSQKNRQIKVRKPKTERFKKSLTYRGPKKWNALPCDLHHANDKALYKKLVCNLVTQKGHKTQSDVCQVVNWQLIRTGN